MAARDEELLKRLLETFQLEAQEHLQAMEAGLVALEKSPQAAQSGLLDAIFRNAHSLKGAARAVNMTDIETVCQALESLFAEMKRGLLLPTPALFDLLHKAVDRLGELLTHLAGGSSAAAKPRTADIIDELNEALAGKTPGSSTKPPAPAPEIPTQAPEAAPASVEEKRGGVETVRVATAKLDAVLLQAEELLFAKQSASQQAAQLRHASLLPAQWKNRWSRLGPDLRLARKEAEDKEGRNGHWDRIVEFLEWNHHMVEDLENKLTEFAGDAERHHRAVGAMVDNLADEMKKVVMQPFSTLVHLLTRMARDLSRNQAKDVELSIFGSEIEVDRRILEEMKDPLIHLVRNAIDHGIESPADREKAGKPARSTLTIGISARSGSHFELLVEDDGAGMDVAKLKTAAGRADPSAASSIETLSNKDALSLAFQSGISTSRLITDLSGRGLGLAIVKEKVERLNGSLTVESEPGRGTTFRIVLPLTLARFHGVVLRLDGAFFVAPTSQVERVIRVKKDEIKTVENRETITMAGKAISLVRLRDVLRLVKKGRPAPEPDVLSVIVLQSGTQRIAFAADEVLREQEVLIKSLGRQLGRVRNIAGATLLEDGQLALVLNTPDLIKSAVQASETVTPQSTSAATTETRRKSILVAEDSITSRTLLKNILETAGYQVETSVDGIDAFTKLRSAHVDLVVSDVDMPRMNGFGLTSKIRADQKLADIPVVLVTALDSRSDREHGIDVGASAYLVKSSFDQSNLLEIIQRLI